MYLGVINYGDPRGIITYLTTVTSKKDTENFIKIIYLVKDTPSELRQFIAVYAPSHSGKTQLACALDKYTEYPLIRYDSTIEVNHVEKSLFVCLRISCAEAFSSMSLSSQTVNRNIFGITLYKVVSKDCEFILRNKTQLLFKSDHDKKSYFSVSCLSWIFNDHHPSYTVGFFVEWIKRRISGEETEALMSSGSLSFMVRPRTINEALKELTVGNDKPIVVILDEYSLYRETGDKNEQFLLLRNIMRACRFVVILMGTNANALNMTDQMAMGSPSSGFEQMLWAQVIVNIFSSEEVLCIPTQIGSIETRQVDPIQNWIQLGQGCLRPGFLKAFIRKLESIDNNSSYVQKLDASFKHLHIALTQRKASFYKMTIHWILGQVRALLSQLDQVYIDGMMLSKTVEETLINSHYAYLNCHSQLDKIPFFTLLRRGIEKKLELTPVGWSNNPQNSDDICLELEAPLESSLKRLEIKGYLTGFKVKAPCKSTMKSESKYKAGCGFPVFLNDEMGYIGFFHTDDPFPLMKSLNEIENEEGDDGLFGDLKEKLSHEVKLTTRAAFTVVFRYLIGTTSPDIYSDDIAPKSGSFVEIVVHAALVIASHKFGLGGSKFTDFLPKFIGELSLKNAENLKLDPASIVLLGSAASVQVPLFPLTNGTCSQALSSIPEVNTGTIMRCPNSDEIDGFGFSDCLKNQDCTQPGAIFLSEIKSLGGGMTLLRLIVEKAVKMQENLLKYNCKQIFPPEKSILARIPPLRQPGHHIHFFILESMSELQIKSQVELYHSCKSVNFLVASLDRAAKTIKLTNLYDQESKLFKEELSKQLAEEDKIKNAAKDTGVNDDTLTCKNETEDLEENEVDSLDSVQLEKQKVCPINPDENSKPIDTKVEPPETSEICSPKIPLTIIILPFRQLFSDDGPIQFAAQNELDNIRKAKKARINENRALFEKLKASKPLATALDDVSNALNEFEASSMSAKYSVEDIEAAELIKARDESMGLFFEKKL